MSNYQDTPVSGNKWQRCCSVSISNEYQQTPRVFLQEEQITEVGGERFKKPVGGLSITFDPAAVINLLDPTTGASLGTTMTQGQIHVALWSLYMQAAAARDAG